MKKFISLTCAILLLFCFSGCENTASEVPESTAPYAIQEENGKFYILFSDDFLEGIETNNTSSSIGSTQQAEGNPIRFSSIAEMKSAIETGSFSEGDLVTLAKKAKNGKLEITDPKKISDYILPTDLDIKTVTWNITSYECDVDWGDNNYDAAYICVDLVGDLYEQYFTNGFLNYASGAKTVISDRIIEDRNAQEFIYTNNTGKYKKLLYQIENGDKVLYVLEHYYLEYYNSEIYDSYLSDTIPFSIQTFCKEDGIGWNTYFKGFNERPTVEWLKSFGIKELAE